MLHPLSRLLLPLLLLGLACGDDASPGNRPPTLIGPTAQPTLVTSGDAVSVTAQASDPDGNTLTYSWKQEPSFPAGPIEGGSRANITWFAPPVDSRQRFTLTVTVRDVWGEFVQGSVDVDVDPPVNENHPPTVSDPTATPSSVEERQTVALAVSASDEDNDALTYFWEQLAPASPRGAFSDPSAAQTTWTAPEGPYSQPFTLRVIVSDGKGGSTQRTVEVAVQTVNQAPTVSATISGPAALVAGATGTFTLTASDADGDPLTYAWSQTAPATQGTWVGSRTGASVQWYSPVVGTQTSFTVSVSVTDGQSAPVVRTLTVPVSVPRYSTDVQSVWSSVPCTGCHGTSGSLSLAAANSYSNLVNVTAGACNTLKRVTPGDPDNSALVRKMEGTACGSRMPRNAPAYFDQNPGLLVRVRSWILAGAAND